MRKLIIKILFRLLNLKQDYQDIQDKQIKHWLQKQKGDTGWHDYYRKRSWQIMKTLASGLERDNYLIWLGHRLELLNLLDQIEKSQRSEKQEPKK